MKLWISCISKEKEPKVKYKHATKLSRTEKSIEINNKILELV